MAKSKKKDLTPEEGKEATAMLNARISLGRVARHFGVNKPSILKGIGLWETGLRKMADGREYRMERGKMIPIIKKGGFQIK